MKKITLISLMLLTTLTGCSTGMGNQYRNEMVKETEMGQQQIEEFFDLMEQSKSGDEKSVYWDGASAKEVADEQDSADVQDGRWNIEKCETITVEDMFEFVYPGDIDEVTLRSEMPEDYHMSAPDLDIHIQQVEYEEAIQAAEKRTSLRKIEGEELSQNQTKYFKDYALYLSVTDTGDEIYAGYQLFFESNLADRAYSISVTGLGNIEELKITALYIMNHFDVLFEN